MEKFLKIPDMPAAAAAQPIGLHLCSHSTDYPLNS
jgi:hypothetical protein